MENSAPLPEITNHETVDLAQRFIQIVAKPPQSRTPKQISTILEYVIINKALRQLSEKLSMKFVKNLLARHANLMCLGPKCLIAAEGDKIKNFYFVIQGTVVRYMKNGKKGIANNHKQDYNIYEKLGILAHKETKENNKLKKRKPVRRLSKQFDDDFHYFRRVNKNYLQSQLQEINLIGLEDRTLGLKYLHDIFTVDKGVLLEIPIQGFLSCLATYLDEKVQKLHDQIIHYPCFVGLDSEVVQSIIISLSEKRHRRGTYIYRQNQPVHSIYFLASGQVRLTKQSNLFVQNPNNLYANRISLMMEPNGQKLKARYQVKQEQMKKAEASLPYADLSLMFNYVPKKKVVQISKLHSFCIFGGQQLIESKKREANAICNSLEVIYYEISVVKLQQILGNKNMPIFVRGLKHEAKDKVLHRQSHFANTINFLNQKNLNYFYYEGEEQKKSHHKIRILKLNSKLEQRNTKLKERYLSLDQKVSVPPQYTAFNFHKLNSLTPIQSNLISRKKLNTVVNDNDIKNPESGQQNGNQSDDEIEDGVVPSTQQMKIMNMTHTWKLIKQKVDVEAIKSQKISPKKYTIDVNQPLIANKYFTQLDKQKRRVERQIRKDKITLGKSRASVLSHHKVPLNSW